MTGASNSLAFQCFCTTKARPVHAPFPASHTFWPNAVRASPYGKIASTTCPTIASLDQRSTQCACHLVSLHISYETRSMLTLSPRSQIIQKWLASVSIRIRRPWTYGRASNDWSVIPKISRWVCPVVSGNRTNARSRPHCHKNHKFRSRANSPMWPVSPRTTHSDISACRRLSGIRSTIGNHEPAVSLSENHHLITRTVH